MTLLEDINSGKYNLVLILILFALVFQIHWSKSTEHMADVSIDSNIKEAIKQVYNADVQAIRNLSEVATKLQAGGLTIPGNLTVTGSISTSGPMTASHSITVGSKNGVDGSINVINKQGGQGILLASNIYDQGGSIYLYAPANPEGQYNYKNHIHYNSSTLVTTGMIVSWTGTAPPEGWALCDGTKGTPDLRGRFVLGFGQGAGLSNRPMGQAGGEEAHTLNINEIPAHSHSYWDTRKFYGSGNTIASSSWNDNTVYEGETGSRGGSQAHNNMPPYYVLAYIMKI